MKAKGKPKIVINYTQAILDVLAGHVLEMERRLKEARLILKASKKALTFKGDR
mgnify:CR=1 FL=1